MRAKIAGIATTAAIGTVVAIALASTAGAAKSHKHAFTENVPRPSQPPITPARGAGPSAQRSTPRSRGTGKPSTGRRGTGDWISERR
jgi:hypothetical protein